MSYSDETLEQIGRLTKYGRGVIENVINAIETSNEQKALRADAERYRWLRRARKDHCKPFTGRYRKDGDTRWPRLVVLTAEDLDESIDKERKA